MRDFWHFPPKMFHIIMGNKKIVILETNICFQKQTKTETAVLEKWETENVSQNKRKQKMCLCLR
jgi:hypothetical protein